MINCVTLDSWIEVTFPVDDVNTVTYCYAGTSRFLKKEMMFF